ncbi:hypothetical protein II5_05836 [Bacillus cereus MSX-A1]|nr:hypothetical protein [Bacillus cereus]EJQ98144.1 hypothetical protein II5_05836 [Bacillus cereus MSX-A1]
MMGALKNHRDQRVSVSVEELVPQDGSVAKFGQNRARVIERKWSLSNGY